MGTVGLFHSESFTQRVTAARFMSGACRIWQQSVAFSHGAGIEGGDSPDLARGLYSRTASKRPPVVRPTRGAGIPTIDRGTVARPKSRLSGRRLGDPISS